MQLVIRVIKNTFLFMFLCFFILEAAYMLFLALLYRRPLSKNGEVIQTVSEDNAKEIANTFSSLLNRKFSSISNDLMLFRKHMKFMKDTLDSSSNSDKETNFVKFIGDSGFVKSFSENCIVKNLENSNTESVLDNIITSIGSGFSQLSNEEIIEKITKDAKDLDKISYFENDNVNTDMSEEKKIDIYKKTYCYAISFLKSLVIKNILIDKEYQSILNYTIFTNSKIFFYPASKTEMKIEDLKELPFYDSSISRCKNNYDLGCMNFKRFDEYGLDKDVTKENSIFYFAPIVRDRKLLTYICSQFKLSNSVNEKPQDQNEDKEKYCEECGYICATYSLSNTIERANIDSTEVIYNIIIYNKDSQDIELLFSSNLNIYDSYNKFDSTAYGKYKLDSTDDNLSLFHSLYFDLEMNRDLTEKQKEEIYNEYNENIKGIIEIVTGKTNEETKEISKSIFVNQTFLEYGYNNKGEKSAEDGSIKKDKYLYYVHKVLSKGAKFKGDKQEIFDETSETLLFYVVIAIKIINPLKTSDVYWIYILKNFRSWVFFFALLLFGSILYFILIQYIMTCLLYPIKLFRISINNLIEKQSSQETNKKVSNNTSTNNSTSNRNTKVSTFDHFGGTTNLGMTKTSRTKNQKDKSENDDENFDYEDYTSVEVKEMEGVYLFLKKILYLNNDETPFQKKAEFYQSISTEIPKDLEIDLFKCQILIGSCYIKVRQYSKASTELENLQKRVEYKQNELKTKYEVNEQKNRNLSSYLGTYINEYSQDKVNDEMKWISLEFISENCHYLLGLANYFQFYNLYHKVKSSKNEPDKKIKIDTPAMKAQREFYLENAISHFRASYKINEHLQINLLKNIVILVFLSKCYFYSKRTRDETNKMLKKAIVVLAKFNKLIIEITTPKDNNSVKCKVDPRVMLIVNGSMFELILYSIGKLGKKLERYKTAYVAINHMLHCSYYKNETLHFKAFKALRRINEIIGLNDTLDSENKSLTKGKKKEYLKKSTIDHLKSQLRAFGVQNEDIDEKNKKVAYELLSDLDRLQFEQGKRISKDSYRELISRYINEYQIYHKINVILNSPLSLKPQEKVHERVEKIFNRLSHSRSYDSPKSVIIIISETFTYKFNALKSFGILMINCINKFIDDDDLLGYMFYSKDGIKDQIDLEEKSTIINQIADKLNNLHQNSNFDTKDFMLTEAFDTAMDMFIDKTPNKYDKYIFCFAQCKDIRYVNPEYTKSQTNKFNYMKISLYYFSFNNNRSKTDEEEIQRHIEHYRRFFRKFIEGVLIFVENFKMIKQGFANITFRGKQKNILSSNLENINNIV